MNAPRPPNDPDPAVPAMDDPRRLALSAVVDGEADASDLSRGCAAWAEDVEARRVWHAYHLIGDVIRSEDLAAPPARDAALLAAVRARLAAEPVVLAPQPPAAARPVRRGAWRLPVALAAGVVAVAGVVGVLEPSVMGGPARPTLASMPGAEPAPGVLRVGGAAVSRDQMLRDARVDEYLRAHRDAFAGSPVALPGGAMRSSVEFQPPQR
jgi:sigma-E factor negative regulatory protein RseA